MNMEIKDNIFTSNKSAFREYLEAEEKKVDKKSRVAKYILQLGKGDENCLKTILDFIPKNIIEKIYDEIEDGGGFDDEGPDNDNSADKSEKNSPAGW